MFSLSLNCICSTFHDANLSKVASQRVVPYKDTPINQTVNKYLCMIVFLFVCCFFYSVAFLSNKFQDQRLPLNEKMICASVVI